MYNRLNQTLCNITLASVLLLGLIGALGPLGLGTVPVQAAPFAYIANWGSNTVSVINTATNTVTTTVPVGTSPSGVAVHPAGTFAYVANTNGSTISVINTATNTVTATVPVGDDPGGVAVHPAGTFVYVANYFSNTVSVINTATNIVTATVLVGASPYGVVVHPAGTRVYVANTSGDTVSVIDTVTNTVVATVLVGDEPYGVAVHPAGTFVYVANGGSGTVSVINTATNTVTATVAVGNFPVGVAVHPAGTFAYVTNRGNDAISVINTATNTVAATVPVGDKPEGVAVNPAGTFAYVANFGSNTISVINTTTNTVTATVPVGNEPGTLGQFISPDLPSSTSAALTLTVRETAGIARSGEVVRSGVPLPRSLNLRSPNTLTLVDAAGIPVPAEFQVLARWNAGLNDTSAPIQWLLVTFPASVTANGSATYRVVTDGSAGPNPPPTTTVSVSQSGNQITVNTGAATFRLGGNPGVLFDEVRLTNSTRLVSGSALTARVNNTDMSHPTTRRVAIEHAGPLTAIVVVEGVYDLPPVGGGGLGSRRRYVFTAGSPTALVRHIVNWEGDRCGLGNSRCSGLPNALRVQRVRDALTLDLPSPRSVVAVGDFQAPALQGSVTVGQTASVRQRLRERRTDPLAFEVSVAGVTVSGTQADGGMLSVSSTSGAVAVALNHMHRYEPQALRLLEDGRLAVDVADDRAWLGNHQGLFATLAVSALAANPSRADLDRLLWAPLNRPLHAWPEPAWFAASDAVDEIPVGSLPADLVGYDTLVASVLTNTLQKVDEKGLAGLMTFGVYPRYWGGTPGDELDCNDLTDPGESWDNLYWCSTWTDYHNTVATAPIWAMRSGEVEWLDEIGFPGALRMLHTQIIQCAPNDTFNRCGTAPTGYSAYRSDFNSSHQYWDNLFLYYWLTGDHTVVETVKRGAEITRTWYCTRRPASPCSPDDPPLDWAEPVGRVASQWFAAFRFVGLASDDASYLEDYKSGLARAVTQYYVEAEQAGTRYGFWLFAPAGGPGTYSTDQLWIASLYDMNMLYRRQRDTNDTPIGNPPLRPSQVLAAWARTLVRFGATVSGNGTAGGTWPNALFFTWSGNRIGGTLSSVSASTGSSDPFLYDTSKACLTALLVRAGQQTGNTALTQMGADLSRLTLTAAQRDNEPLNKLEGEYLSRLHAAVARLAAASSNNGVNTAPFGYVDIPAPGATVQGTINVEGWGLDREDSSLTVQLWIDGSGVSSSPTRFARPDVCAAFASVSHCSSSNPGVRFSWNTATVSNGAHTLALRVTDPQGLSATVGSRTVTVNNP